MAKEKSNYFHFSRLKKRNFVPSIYLYYNYLQILFKEFFKNEEGTENTVFLYVFMCFCDKPNDTLRMTRSDAGKEGGQPREGNR